MLLPISIALNFVSDISNSLSGTSKLGKGLSDVSSAMSSLGVDSKKFSGDFTQYQYDMASALSGLTENVKIFSEANLDAVTNLRTAYLNTNSAAEGYLKTMEQSRNVSALKSVEDVLSSLVIGYDKLGAGGKNFNTNMKNLLELDPKNFKTIKESFESFNTNIEKYGEKTVGHITNLMDELQRGDVGAERVRQITKEIDNLVKQKEGLDKLKDSISGVLGGWGARLAGLVGMGNIASDMLRAQDIVYKSTARMAMVTGNGLQTLKVGSQTYLESFRKTAMQIEKTAINTAKTTSIRFEDAAETMSSLLNQRVPTKNIDEIGELSTSAIQLSQAFGISRDQAVQFTSDLMKIGGVGVKGIRDVGDSLSNLQANLGLNAEEMGEVTAQTGRMLQSLNVLNSKPKDIGKMVAAVGKLQIAFKKVGLDASDANRLIDDAMNPDNFDKVAAAAAIAGVDVGKALEAAATGNQAFLTDMYGKASNKIQGSFKNMGVAGAFAMKGYEETIGLTRQQMIGVSKAAEMAGEKATVSTDLSTQAEANRLSMVEQSQKLWSQIAITISETMLPVMEDLTVLLKNVVDGFINFSKWLDSLGPLAKTVFAVMLLGFMNMGAVMKLIFSGPGLFMGMVKNFGSAISSMGSMGKKFSEGLSNVFSGIKGPSAVASPAANAAGAASSVAPSSVSKAGAAPKLAPAPAAGPFSKAADAIGKFGVAILKLGAGLLLVAAAVYVFVLAMKELFYLFKNDAGAAWQSLGALGAIIGMTIGVLFALQAASKKVSPDIMKLGVAMLMVAASVYVLALAMEKISTVMAGTAGWQSLGALVGIIGALTIAIKVLSSVSKSSSKNILPLGVAMLMLAASVYVLALAMEKMSTIMASENGWKGIAAIGVILIAFSGAIKILSSVAKTSAAQLLPLGVAMVMLAGSVYILALAMEKISSVMSSGNGLESFGALAGMIAVLTASIVILSKVGASSAGPMLAMGAGMLMVAGSVYVLALAMEKIVSLIQKDGNAVLASIAGLIVVIAALGAIGYVAGTGVLVLGAGMLLLGAGVALVVGSVALLVLSITGLIMAMNSVDPGKLLAGMGAMAGGLILIIGSLALGMFVLAPALIALGAAAAIAGPGLMSIGIALLAVGAGILLAGTGFALMGQGLLLIAQNGVSAGIGITAVGVALFGAAIGLALGGSAAIVAGAGFTLLGVGLAIASAGLLMITGLLSTLSGSLKSLTEIDMGKFAINMGLLLATLAVFVVGALLIAPAVASAGWAIAGAMLLIVGAAAGLGLALGVISGGISSLSDGMDKLIRTFSQSTNFSSVAENMKTTFIGLNDSIKGIDWSNLKEVSKIGNGFKDFADAIASITDGFGRFISTVQNVPDLKEKMVPLQEALKSLMSGFSGMANETKDVNSNNITAMGPAFEGFGKGIGSMLGPLSTFIETMDKLKDMDFAKMGGNISLLLGSAFSSLTDTLVKTKDVNSNNISAMSGTFEGFANSLKSVFDIIQSVSTMDPAQMAGNISTLKAISNTMQEIMIEMVTKLKDIINKDFAETFKLMSEGMKSMTDSIVSINGVQINTANIELAGEGMKIMASKIKEASDMMKGGSIESIKLLGETMTATGTGLKSFSDSMGSIDAMMKNTTNFTANMDTFGIAMGSLLTKIKDQGSSDVLNAFANFSSNLKLFTDAVATSSSNIDSFSSSLSKMFTSMGAMQGSEETVNSIKTMVGAIAMAANVDISKLASSLATISTSLSNLNIPTTAGAITSMLINIASFGDAAANSMDRLAKAINSINILNLGALMAGGLNINAQMSQAQNQVGQSTNQIQTPSASSNPQSETFGKINASMERVAINSEKIVTNTGETVTQLKNLVKLLSNQKPQSSTNQQAQRGTTYNGTGMGASGI